MKKASLIILLIVSSTCFVQGQQDAQFTHYMFNTLSVNPGYAGSREAFTITGLYRNQWLGFPGAPTTQTLTMHSPFLQDQIGAGLSIINDEIGPTKMTSLYADFAYKMKVGQKGKLSFGLKGGINQRRNDLAKLRTTSVGDDSFAINVASELLPNFGFGIYYNQVNFYSGLSVPRLLKNTFKNEGTGTGLSTDVRHFFYIAGAVFKLSQQYEIKLKPTVLIKYSTGAPLDLDLTAIAMFHDRFWAGPMWRLGDGMGALIGFNILPQLAASYSFDWSSSNNTSKYNSGSHEIMLRYDFIYKNAEKVRSPRYF